MTTLKQHTQLKTNEQTCINMRAYNFRSVPMKPSESTCSSDLMEKKEQNRKNVKVKGQSQLQHMETPIQIMSRFVKAGCHISHPRTSK